MIEHWQALAAGVLFCLPACVIIAVMAWSVQEMTKQELAHIAKVMYDLQEYCRYIDELNNHEECNGCTFLYGHVKCRLIALTKDNKIPCDNWGITKTDIERWESEE